MTCSVPREELVELCQDALRGVGAASRDAWVLAEATVEAELAGNRAVGVAHLFDYLEGYRHGRISKDSARCAQGRASGDRRRR